MVDDESLVWVQWQNSKSYQELSLSQRSKVTKVLSGKQLWRKRNCYIGEERSGDRGIRACSRSTSTNLSFFLALPQSHQTHNLRANLKLISRFSALKCWEEMLQNHKRVIKEKTNKLTCHFELTVFPGASRCPRRRYNGPFGEKL